MDKTICEVCGEPATVPGLCFKHSPNCPPQTEDHKIFPRFAEEYLLTEAFGIYS